MLEIRLAPPAISVLLLMMVFVLFSWSLIGCESTPQANGGIGQAMHDYENGRYTVAHRRAVESLRGASGVERDKAAYIAGMSAYRFGDKSEADLRFNTAINSQDPIIAGRAKAMLGQIRMDQGRPREAVTLFEEAARQLDGPDAMQARQYARLARNEAGLSSNGDLTNPLPPGSGFALQIGAFQDRRHADRAAEQARDLAHRDGLGSVRIVPRTDQRGRELYVVQLGEFGSRDEASRVRQRVGRLDYIVAPLASATR